MGAWLLCATVSALLLVAFISDDGVAGAALLGAAVVVAAGVWAAL